MSTVVFLGPSLRANAVPDSLNATILPPVQQGDVYRAVQTKPKAIGIIDGYFDGVPSVWHKEILWAIQQGIPVFGSASMGALRAAELADFGMIGVGHIFEGFRDGTLQDDDEVAVLHGPAELGFPPLSEPMVSIRASINRALAQDILSNEVASEMERIAKCLNYRDRTWDNILQEMNGHPETEAFRQWLPDGYIDAKGDDARAMLSEIAAHLECPDKRARAPQHVERTLAWRELCARIDCEPTPQEVHSNGLVDELRLDPVQYARLRDQAMLTLLARDESHRQDHHPDRKALIRQMSNHRVTSGLSRHAELLKWLDSNDLSPAQYEGMLADKARNEAVAQAFADRLDGALLAEMRHADIYPVLRDRAQRKAQVFAEKPEGNTAENPANRARALIWYFESRLDQTVPDDLDSYASALGLDGRDAFLDLIEAEYLFCQLLGGPAQTASLG